MNTALTALALKRILRPASDKTLSGMPAGEIKAAKRVEESRKTSGSIQPERDKVFISLRANAKEFSTAQAESGQEAPQNQKSLSFARVQSENKAAAEAASKLFHQKGAVSEIARLFNK